MPTVDRTKPNSNYIPQPYTGDDNHALVEWLMGELRRVALAFELKAQFETSYVAPPKPRDGLIVLADGVKWNPGSGQGFYGYYNNAWHFLG